MIERVLAVLGVEFHRINHAERLVSMLGAFLGILSVYLLGSLFVGDRGSALLVASMGASAVLLFAVPHGALSQPWPLIGGHLVSALIGVTCARYVPVSYLAAPLAVGLAVGAMYYLRCIHPPGGATALTATVGGTEVAALGYQFVVTPVLLNLIAILAIAVAFNYPFAWRRYPVYLGRDRLPASATDGSSRDTLSHDDIEYALSEMNSFIDVTEHDLRTLFELLVQGREGEPLDPSRIELGRFYSNAQYGARWSVRQIIDWGEDTEARGRQVIYKVVAGEGRRNTGVAFLDEFARWARYEVFLDEENWRRIPGPGSAGVSPRG